MTRLRTVSTPVPGIAIWYDFVTPAEEQYLIQAIGGDPQPQPGPQEDGSAQSSSSSNVVATAGGDDDDGTTATTGTHEASTGSNTPRKAWGWKDLNGRRSMYWGGTVTPSGSLVPAPFPTFMDSAWPNVLDRIAETGVYDEWTGGKGKGKERGPNHCLVNEYLPGQGIMPHTDGPAYLPCTSTLSLGSHTVLCLRSKPSHLALSSSSSPNTDTDTDSTSDSNNKEKQEEDDEARRAASIAAVQKLDLFLPARSLVVLTSTLYSDWLHGIAPLKGDSIDSLMGCANWDDWWTYQREVQKEGEGGAEKEREMVEAGKGWERQRRISLTCRRVAGKVRNLGSMLGLGGGGGASRGARRS
ncbi:hypothetical protein C6P46_003868 [Rhodotorula mucilaginosa]|uniref:Fe2OG dioxygenase domain-containing protein n=1 Tax=Rhodotorula mucilaginosa TaxID=5537 RepID=A0A9P7B6L6_RHOMI|nr:hypothetical protein C6P46_003868 [Rhodotorula mucilaginosa]TKA51132.1 hypothetical protein B0A53_05950 [Rhodotorula sp. CCFEE 5036]